MKISSIKNGIQGYISGKFKNATRYISEILHFGKDPEFYPLREIDPSTELRPNNEFMLTNSNVSKEGNAELPA